MDKIYYVDLNVTKQCNFQCKYCFIDKKGKQIFDEYANFVEFIFKLLESDFFKKNYDILGINFWGGEPTLFPSQIVNCIDDLAYYKNIRFFIFSNGYDLDIPLTYTLMKYRDKKVGVHPRLCIQISYDGYPIHNMYRKSNGKNTSQKVRENIRFLDKNKIPYVIKSTVPPEAFKYMYAAYVDIKNFAKECNNTGFYKNINYFPTIDYYHLDFTEDEMTEYCEDLENSLVKIAAQEAKDKTSFFKWFEPNRAICASGQHMVAVDTDENIYVCHGCLYGDNKDQHLIGNINNNGIIEKLEKVSKYFGTDIADEGECKNCDVSFCLRCNQAKYDNSKKEKYMEKWRDYTNQPNLCKFYKINSNVKKGLDLFRRKNE